MRIVLAFALLLLFAPVAFAQQADTPAPPAQTEAQAQDLAHPDLDLEKLRTAEANVVQQQIVPAEAPAAVAQPDRRGWWWLVLAFVAAGVILWLVGIF